MCKGKPTQKHSFFVIINWIWFWSIKIVCPGEFPGGLLVKTWAFTAVDVGSISGQGTKITQAMQCSQSHTHTHTHISGVSCCDSVTCNFLRPHELQHSGFSCPSLSPCLLKLMSTESVMPSNYLILCYPLLLLPSIRGEGWDELGSWDWPIYTIDTMYRVLIRTYCIVQGIPV